MKHKEQLLQKEIEDCNNQIEDSQKERNNLKRILKRKKKRKKELKGISEAISKKEENYPL